MFQATSFQTEINNNLSFSSIHVLFICTHLLSSACVGRYPLTARGLLYLPIAKPVAFCMSFIEVRLLFGRDLQCNGLV